MTGRYSKKARRHAKQSRMRTKRTLALKLGNGQGQLEVYFERPIRGGAHAQGRPRR